MFSKLLILAILSASALLSKTYAVDGIVVAVDPASRTMLVSHREIARYMPAMMMPFRVAVATELGALHAGERVAFELEVTKTQSIARHVHPTGATDAALAPSPQKLALGAPLPEFTLTDQNGLLLGKSDLRGKVVAIDFIYTRCPLPDVCPRLSANFALLQRRFGPAVTLLSVTVDPDFDTPAVLRAYARRWGAAADWRFLTGEVAPLAAALGELYWSDEGSIGHNSSTAIVGRDGRLAAVVEGSSFRAEQLAHLIARQLEEHP